MISINVNGQAQDHEEGSSIAALVSAMTGRQILETGVTADGGGLGLAVALNAELVPRSRWSATILRPADEVEVVTAVQGG